MSYKLKPSENAFQVTREGEFEFKSFRHGEVYERIPKEEAHRFEEVGAGPEKHSHHSGTLGKKKGGEV